jgi:hypothetical protein
LVLRREVVLLRLQQPSFSIGRMRVQQARIANQLTPAAGKYFRAFFTFSKDPRYREVLIFRDQ